MDRHIHELHLKAFNTDYLTLHTRHYSTMVIGESLLRNLALSTEVSSVSENVDKKVEEKEVHWKNPVLRVGLLYLFLVWASV